MALFTMLSYNDITFGGFISLGGFIPQLDAFKARSLGALRSPIFLGHGVLDAFVPHDRFVREVDYLRSLGGSRIFTARSYPFLVSGICEEEVRDLGAFVGAQLRPHADGIASNSA